MSEKGLTKQQSQMKNLSDVLNDPVNMAKIQAGAPKYLNSDALIRIALTAVGKSEKLLQCSAGSILQALMDCAAYGLLPSSATNEAHLVPFGKNVVLVVGYKGLIKMATNTGLVSGVRVRKVYENDKFVCEMGLDEKLEHIPAPGDRGKFKGAYAVVQFSDGEKDWSYLSIEDGLAHGKRFSKSFNNGPWKTDPESMVCKTVVRMALKYVPASPESERLSIAIARDEKMESSQDFLNIPSTSDKEDIPEPEVLDVDSETGEVMEQSSLDLDKELLEKESKA